MYIYRSAVRVQTGVGLACPTPRSHSPRVMNASEQTCASISYDPRAIAGRVSDVLGLTLRSL